MSERLNELVLKTSRVARLSRVRISPPPHFGGRIPPSPHRQLLSDELRSNNSGLHVFRTYMDTQDIPSGTVHTIPIDLHDAIVSRDKVRTAWTSLTPIARDEWICWVTIVKKAETRSHHIARLCAELTAGKRRPCCWPGCPHRRPNARKWF